MGEGNNPWDHAGQADFAGRGAILTSDDMFPKINKFIDDVNKKRSNPAPHKHNYKLIIILLICVSVRTLVRIRYICTLSHLLSSMTDVVVKHIACKLANGNLPTQLGKLLLEVPCYSRRFDVR